MSAISDAFEQRASVRFAGAPGGAILFFAGLAVAFIAFWPGLANLVDAWSIPEYSHGPIIPLISLFLFLREMRHVPAVERRITDRWPGVAVMVVGLIGGMLGRLVSIPDIVTYSFMVWLTGLTLTCFGLRRGVLFWPAIVHLVFMLPLPQFLYWQVSTFLQTVSSQIGVWFVYSAGIPVYLDGNIIDLGVYKLQVAEACSGLRYLFPMLSFSYVFAVLYQGPVWHKLLLLAMAAPITVLMNSFRIGMIGVLVNSYGIEQAEGFLHSFEGWVIFIACVAILFLIAMVLQRLTRNPKPLSEALDIEFAGLGAQLGRVRGVVASPALIAAVLLTAGVAAATVMTPERQAVEVDREPLALFPRTLGDWRGALNPPLDRSVARTLGADDYFSALYSAPSAAASVDVFLAFYRDQLDGTGIHSPEVCVPAGGWEVSAWRGKTVTLANGEEIALIRAIIQKGVSRQLVYFWFEMRGQRLTDPYRAKFANLVDQVREGRSDGGIVRLITPMADGETIDVAGARIEALIRELAPDLPRFMPN